MVWLSTTHTGKIYDKIYTLRLLLKVNMSADASDAKQLIEVDDSESSKQITGGEVERSVYSIMSPALLPLYVLIIFIWSV